MKKTILNLVVIISVLFLASCSYSDKWIVVQSSTGNIASWNIEINKTIPWTSKDNKEIKKWCEVIYESLSKTELKKRRFSFHIEWDCKNKIINWSYEQEWNLLETPNWMKFEIQDASWEYSTDKLIEKIKLLPFDIMRSDETLMQSWFATDTIKNKNNLQIQVWKIILKKENNINYPQGIIMANFDTFLIKNYSESFQKNLNENNIEETYNELKIILSTVKELPSQDVSFSLETVDVKNIKVKWNTFILKDKNWIEKIVKIDQTKIFKFYTIDEFEKDMNNERGSFLLKWNILTWSFYPFWWATYTAETNIETWEFISWWFENIWGFDNLN